MSALDFPVTATVPHLEAKPKRHNNGMCNLPNFVTKRDLSEGQLTRVSFFIEPVKQ